MKQNKLNRQGAKIRYAIRVSPLLEKLDGLALKKTGRWTDFERRLYETAVSIISKPLKDEIRCRV